MRCEDLALDLWVTPSDQTTILDEDEFAALNLPPESQKQSKAALNILLKLACTGKLPA